MIVFSAVDMQPTLLDNFPFDKYEVESCALTQRLLAREQGTCWQIFIRNSGRQEGLGSPFGFLKANSTLSCVNLFVLPYNYPKLFPLLGGSSCPSLVATSG